MQQNDRYSMLYGNPWTKNNGKDKSTLVQKLQSDLNNSTTIPKEQPATNHQHSQSNKNNETQASIDATNKSKNTTEISSMPKIIPHTNKLITDWNVLVDLANNCTNCGLCNNRTNVVIERGSRDAKWVFIGEGPGENEDLEGKPFVGRSGQLLDKMIAACNLDKDKDVYICNVVKCRPPKNRNPEAKEIEACSKFLLSQLNLVKPKVIVVLGRIAAQMLLQTDTAIGKLRGTTQEFNGIPLIVTYHPAYLLRNPPAKKDAWEDLQLAMKIYNS